MTSPVFHLTDRITLVPVLHGSGDVAVAIRRILLENEFDCLAIPLPQSFKTHTLEAVEQLPHVQAVVQMEAANWSELSDGDVPPASASFVPIDPCQPLIAAMRFGIQERMPIEFIDLETEQFEQGHQIPLDTYSIRLCSLEHLATAALTSIPPILKEQLKQRIAYMAAQLKRLSQSHKKILCLCEMQVWPWLRDAFQQQDDHTPEPEEVLPCLTYPVKSESLFFMLGELPFITGLYEQARAELDADDQLSVDGIKQLLLETRQRYKREMGSRGRKITPKLLASYLKYARNLSLIERRLTPDLYTLVVSARQIFGDAYALSLLEQAREYRHTTDPNPEAELVMGIDQARLPGIGEVRMKNRLAGPIRHWKTLQLQRRPPQVDQDRWAARWNPYHHCSYPPEDESIEKFRTHVKEHALQLLGNDLARTEKFTTSLKDGLDIRETLRNWHTGELYVKELPPTRGGLDCVVMLFEVPADPRVYANRVTWHAEHDDESTLAFFSTALEEIVGPGIARSTYGGALFLFPPRPIADIWQDRRFDFCDTLEERLIAAGSYHSEHKHIAVLCDGVPGRAWKKVAAKFGKKLIHVPLARFSQETIQNLRSFHVLNGQHVRSYASHFIRRV